MDFSLKLKNKITATFNSINSGHERSVKAKKNIIASLVLKGGSIGVNLLLVPLTINYINATQYGIWITLASIIGWFSFFDIGFGNGLRNKFAESVSKGKIKLARIYVSTTYAVLSIMVVFVLILFYSVNPFLNWAKILNAPSSMATELKFLSLIIFSFFCLQFVLQLISIIVSANQQPSIASLFNFLGSLFSLAIIFILTKTTSGNLIILGFSLGIAPIVIFGISTLLLFSTSYKRYAPSFKLINFKYAKELLNIGSKFFIIQIGAIIIFETNNIVIAQILGPHEVTVFNVAYKLFFVVIMLFSIFMSPFWSAFTDAYIKGDLLWIMNIFKKIKRYWLYSIFLSFLILTASPLIFKFWLGDSVHVPFLTSFFLTFYVIGYNLLMIYCFFLNGIGKIRLQLYLYLFSASINIPLAILFGKLYGLPGIIFSNVLLFSIMAALLLIQTNKILNKTAFGIWRK